jgi:DNA-binding NarL/FixJ family response regulator
VLRGFAACFPYRKYFRGDTLDRPRILLADDEPDFLAVSARLLEPAFEVVKTVGDGQQVLEETARLEPDLLVLDISMPVLNGMDAARRLRSVGCRAKIVFLTVHREPEYIQAGFAAGARGYVIKSRLVSDLPLALREVLAGRSFVSPSIKEEAGSTAQYT